MQDFIARENIRRFRSILQQDLTEQERQTVLRLLQVEEQKLLRLASVPPSRPDTDA